MEKKKVFLTHKLEKANNKTVTSRRSFLKRSVYSTPVLMAMGQLVKPINAQAEGVNSVPPIPGDGDGDGWNPNP